MLQLAIVLTLSGATGSSLAASVLTDPTRPPARLTPPPSEAAAPEAAEPVVESVIIAPGVRAAVINGQRVRLGDRLGEARVVRITEREVALETGKRVDVLRVYPQVQVRPAAAGGQPRDAAGAR